MLSPSSEYRISPISTPLSSSSPRLLRNCLVFRVLLRVWWILSPFRRRRLSQLSVTRRLNDFSSRRPPPLSWYRALILHPGWPALLSQTTFFVSLLSALIWVVRRDGRDCLRVFNSRTFPRLAVFFYSYEKSSSDSSQELECSQDQAAADLEDSKAGSCQEGSSSGRRQALFCCRKTGGNPSKISN